MKNQLLLIICLSLFSFSLFAQDETSLELGQKIRIEMADGNRFIGEISAIDKETIVLKTESTGEIKLRRSRIKTVKIIREKDMVDGTYWFPNPNRSRYYIGPSAMGLKEGEGFYQNIMLFYNGIGYGVSDNVSFSIGGNFIIPNAHFFLGNLQISGSFDEQMHFGGGATVLLVPEGGWGTFVYGVGTFGGERANLSLNVGYGFTEDGFADNPFASIAGFARVSKHIAFVTENFIIPTGSENFVLATYGFRYLGERISVDFAFINGEGISQDIPIGFPFATVVIAFGGK